MEKFSEYTQTVESPPIVEALLIVILEVVAEGCEVGGEVEVVAVAGEVCGRWR